MTRKTKKLSLNKETVRSLDQKVLRKVAGGLPRTFDPQLATLKC